MTLCDTLLNTFRISPHGMTLGAFSIASVADMALGLGFYESLPHAAQPLDILGTMGVSIAGMFFVHLGTSLYRNQRAIIKQNSGLLEPYITARLRFYCHRQAYRAAAYSLGLKEQFDALYTSYRGKKDFNWMPDL